MNPESAILRNHLLPKPHQASEILTDGNIGVFDILKDTPLLHGFSWIKPSNMSYTKETDYPHPDAIDRVRERLSNFLDSLSMQALDKAVVGVGYPGCTDIVDIDQKVLNTVTPTENRGRFIEAGAFFTTTHTPIYAIAGDCTWSFLYAKSAEGDSIAGLIHSGRLETNLKYPQTVIEHLQKVYGTDLKTVRIGIIPSLEPQHHTIRSEDIHRFLPDLSDWQPYIAYSPRDNVYHLDVRSYVADQFIMAGVPADNIEVATAGTYESAEVNRGFSHRRATILGIPSFRFGIAVQLENS
jgi:copper oxidase (laccase) domain-containing protein